MKYIKTINKITIWYNEKNDNYIIKRGRNFITQLKTENECEIFIEFNYPKPELNKGQKKDKWFQTRVTLEERELLTKYNFSKVIHHITKDERVLKEVVDLVLHKGVIIE